MPDTDTPAYGQTVWNRHNGEQLTYVRALRGNQDWVQCRTQSGALRTLKSYQLVAYPPAQTVTHPKPGTRLYDRAGNPWTLRDIITDPQTGRTTYLASNALRYAARFRPRDLTPMPPAGTQAVQTSLGF